MLFSAFFFTGSPLLKGSRLIDGAVWCTGV